MSAMTIEERDAMLAAALPRYVAGGWRVVAVLPASAQIARSRPLDPGAAIASFLLCGIGLLIYLGVHFARGDETAYLTMDEHGKLHEYPGHR